MGQWGHGCGGSARWARDATSWCYGQTHGMCQGKKEGGEGVLSNGHIPTGKTTRDFPLEVTCLSRREAFMCISTANTEDGENPPNAITLSLVQGSQGAQNSLILSRRMLPSSCLQGLRFHIHRNSLEVCGAQRQLFGRCLFTFPSFVQAISIPQETRAVLQLHLHCLKGDGQGVPIHTSPIL